MDRKQREAAQAKENYYKKKEEAAKAKPSTNFYSARPRNYFPNSRRSIERAERKV
jgi:hypothetical protein